MHYKIELLSLRKLIWRRTLYKLSISVTFTFLVSNYLLSTCILKGHLPSRQWLFSLIYLLKGCQHFMSITLERQHFHQWHNKAQQSTTRLFKSPIMKMSYYSLLLHPPRDKIKWLRSINTSNHQVDNPNKKNIRQNTNSLKKNNICHSFSISSILFSFYNLQT
jgi:hypothetical protein